MVQIDRKTIISAAVAAIVWALTYYYVRRGMNPEVEDPSKYKTDAFYGALAQFVSKILLAIISPLL